jgi:hypothetical protein
MVQDSESLGFCTLNQRFAKALVPAAGQDALESKGCASMLGRYLVVLKCRPCNFKKHWTFGLWYGKV